MGYEIIFHYKEVDEKPGVYKEEVKIRPYRVGKTTEDVSLDALAGKILSQLARRNILIVDVEIYEYAKKKLSYRETENGIVLKNKKFSFDSGTVSSSEEFQDESEVEDFKPLPTPSVELANKSCPLVSKNLTNLARRPIRYELFEPEPIGLHKAKQKGLKFTFGKKYPIYSEGSVANTIAYKTKDDSGNEVDVSAEYFVAIGSGLVEQEQGPSYVGAEMQKEEINLWRNYESADMPDIRGGR